MKVKECTYWLKMYVMGATYPCSSHVLEQRKKKKHHDLSVEDNNILLTSTKEQKRNTLFVFISQTDRRGGEELCLFAPET
jgi:hypothetical protein